MDKWTRKDVTGKIRAQNLLQPCARLVRHGHKAEALGKIAGGVALGFADAAHVAKQLRVTPAELSAAVDRYRQAYEGNLK